jgi:hypothetical protein
LTGALACVVLTAGLASPASADTGPTLTGISPNAVRVGSDATLTVSGANLDPSWSLRWRGFDHPLALYVDDSSASARCCITTIPASELAIEDAFLTISAFVTRDGASSNALPVTVLGDGGASGASALAGAGETATVTTDLLTARYGRAAAGFGIVTAVDYRFVRGGPPIVPTPPPISPVAFVDLQVLGAGAGDSVVGTFLPPNPIVPVTQIGPSPPPILPPNPIRLAYWSGSSWDPVFGSGDVAPIFSFDAATTSASPATVTFDETSTPQVTALGGTVFAFVASHGFVGFDRPIEPDVVNVAKAGRAVPLKWRVLDLGGNPVTDLDPAGASLTSTAVGCSALDGDDAPLDAYAPGSSGLQNLGDGHYQWNWATQKSWASSCRRLTLRLGDTDLQGAPIDHSVNFEFGR